MSAIHILNETDPVSESGTATLASTSQQIKSGPGLLTGFYVNNTVAGTLDLYDSTAATTGSELSGTITPAAGWHAFPVRYQTSLWAEINNVLSVTFVWK